jgi:two-component system, LytTR family, sensor kinase
MTDKSHHPLGFSDRWFRIVGIPFLGVIIPAIFFGKTLATSEDYFISAGICTCYTFTYWHICRAIFIWGNRKFPAPPQYLKRLAFILGICFTIMLSFCNIMHFCLEKYIFGGLLQPPSSFQINAASFFCLIMISGMYESKRYVMLWKKTSLENEQLQRENIQSQLDGLKSQVNPHFLFNSLNTLVNIIPEHPETAVRFVQKLSKVYRYILEIRDTQTTPLRNELDFIQAYMFLLKERFGENISVKIAENIERQRNPDSIGTEGVLDREIAPLSLQILFENAIKHNIISTEKPLLIEISIENERLIVKNNLQRKNQVQEGTGLGLENIKNRYRLICNKEVDIIVTQQSFMVSLPLLKNHIETFNTTEIINN